MVSKVYPEAYPQLPVPTGAKQRSHNLMCSLSLSLSLSHAPHAPMPMQICRADMQPAFGIKQTNNSSAAPAEDAQVPHEKVGTKLSLSSAYRCVSASPLSCYVPLCQCQCQCQCASVPSARSKLQRGGFGTRPPPPPGRLCRYHPSCWVTQPTPPHSLNPPRYHPTTTDACVSHRLLQYRPLQVAGQVRHTVGIYGLTDYICFRFCRLQSNYPRAANTNAMCVGARSLESLYTANRHSFYGRSQYHCACRDASHLSQASLTHSCKPRPSHSAEVSGTNRRRGMAYAWLSRNPAAGCRPAVP